MKRTPSPHQSIEIVIMPEVHVTESVLTMTGINMMCSIGGILGLMLVLGVLQIVELADKGLNAIIMCFIN